MEKSAYKKANSVYTAMELCRKCIKGLDGNNFAAITFDLKAKNPDLYDEFKDLCKTFFNEKIAQLDVEFNNI